MSAIPFAQCAAWLLIAAALHGCATDEVAPPPPGCHQGVLVDGGGRCQALRRPDGSTITFYADMNGWRLGQQACVCGEKAVMTQCPRENAIEATWLAPFCPPTEGK